MDTKRKLESKNKFHIKRPRKKLPEDLKKELEKRGASECDKDIIRLALWRKEKSGNAVIITNNEDHFQKLES